MEMTAPNLNAVFAALADPTRRAIVARLCNGPVSVMDLAKPFNISQPAVSKHLKVLERAGLISRGIDQQRRPATLTPEALDAAMRWLEDLRALWDQRLDTLDNLLIELKSELENPND